MAHRILCKSILEIGKLPKTIDTPWTGTQLAKSVEPDVLPHMVFIFNPAETGFGDIDLMFPAEFQKPKWKQDNVRGLVTFQKSGTQGMVSLQLACVPLENTDVSNHAVVSAFLQLISQCYFCKKVTRHVKISNSTGQCVCMDCFKE